MALILFLSGKKKLLSSVKNLPERSNNPFGLVQMFPSNWIGLKGKNQNGFLEFDSPLNGVRAGFINLHNRYFAMGLNTLATIYPVYSGLSDASEQIKTLSQLTGFTPNQILSKVDYSKLGRAIERIENGSNWVSTSDWNNGFVSAKKYLGLQ